jgi:putative ABC transport system ATP-binding protein
MGASNPSPLISVRDLSHAFGSGTLRKKVLDRVSVDFYSGEIVIIMGPSGSGKTTFLTLIGGLRAVEEGSAVVGGIELAGAVESERTATRRKVGFIFQAHNLIESLTACENVQMVLVSNPRETASSSRKKALDALAGVGLAEHAHKQPRQLSGGQKQRVAIARALVREPAIIMADEPTAALDKKTGREVVDLLKFMARQKGCTILLVTHDNRILDVADRIIKIEDGAMEDSGVGMERLVMHLAGLLNRLVPYAESFVRRDEASHLELENSRTRFAEEAERLNRRMLGMIEGRLNPAMRERARIVQGVLGHIGSIEASLARLAVQMHEEAVKELPGLPDQFSQSLQFLLLTAEEALRSREVENAALLLALTADRGETMNRLRAGYFERETHLSPEARTRLFDLTQSFVRNVYMLHQLAIGIKDWVPDLTAGDSSSVPA